MATMTPGTDLHINGTYQMLAGTYGTYADWTAAVETYATAGVILAGTMTGA